MLNYPQNKPGIARGPCPTDSGVPSVVEGLYGKLITISLGPVRKSN